jgi:hypothetical protein
MWSTLSYWWNYVPWWVAPIVLAIVLVATIPYWLPLWAGAPKWLKTLLVALGGGLTIYQMGRNKGRKDSDAQIAKQNAQAEAKRTEVDNEIANLNPADRDKRLDRWLRDK